MKQPQQRLEHLLKPLPEHLMVAVSGGVDSVAMLHALISVGKKPVVLHFHHGWREESDLDRSFVKSLAAGYGLKFMSAKARTSSAVKKQETEARRQRYDFFAKAAAKVKIQELVLAHQADDQVETYLLHLLRGSGAGSQGMRSQTSRDGLVLLRPWLSVWREEIVCYARFHHLAWKEDSSNRDVRYRRNFIRHRLVPYLKKNISSQISRNLLRAAEIYQAEQTFWEDLCHSDALSIRLSVAYLKSLPLARQRRTLLLWLQQWRVRDISFQDVEAVRGLLEQRLPAKVNLTQGRFVRRRAGEIFLS